MYDKVECPYCDEEQDINIEDVEEDEQYESQCENCDKNFIYTLSISYDYFAEKADCLNGGKHKMLKAGSTFYPDRIRCLDCTYEELGRKASYEERNGV